MKTAWSNNTIICVDDEKSIRDAYTRILSPTVDDSFSEIFSLAGELEDKDTLAASTKPPFNLLLASSGEEAIEIIKDELRNGRKVAAGFFDMRMPGGMDGFETIQQARQLDNDLICCVVTAYTDRNVQEIRALFTDTHQDELLYIKKPFSVDELDQAAVNMLSSWNRKRILENHLKSVEKQRSGLRQILHAISTFNKIPPHSLRYLTAGLLFQLLGMVEGENGFCLLLSDNAKLKMNAGVGRYEHDGNLVQTMNGLKIIEKSFQENRVLVEGCFCSIPFLNVGNKLGVMYIESSGPIFDYLDYELLEVFKNQMASMIMTSMYHEEMLSKDSEAITDELTGLYNRRFYAQRLKDEILRTNRKKIDITMLMVDIDDFKTINDEFGHDAGDLVLKSLGNIIQITLRNGDLIENPIKKIGREDQFAIRYGGEEFSLVLLNTESDGAFLAAERLRKRIEGHIIRYSDHEIKLTVSIGLHTEEFNSDTIDHDSFLSDVYKKADLALYQAKKTGKNKVVVFQNEEVN